MIFLIQWVKMQENCLVEMQKRITIANTKQNERVKFTKQGVATRSDQLKFDLPCLYKNILNANPIYISYIGYSYSRRRF